ncbi:MAG: CoB--CoM heterodisulfide reductase iron-sulfur subunit A family protein, partial [Syntrophobacteraceae bacterium]
MDKKIAVYICTGCGIGEALDIEQLSKVATSECKAAVCKNHSNLCSPEGAQLIKDDVANDGVNTLIIAACSQRVMYDVFNFEGTIMDRVNLREQVVWSHPANDEDTQMMAEDYIRMSAARMKQTEPPEPFKPEQELSKDILVVGGGTTGMTAALEVAGAGYSAVLVEMENELGGFQKNVSKNVVFPFKDVQANEINRLIAAVNSNEKIKVLTGSKIEKLSGGPCVFNARIKQNGSTSDHNIGAVVLAAGWKPYDPEKLDKKLGYGASANVITNVQFEERAMSGKITRPADGKALNTVAFIQCAGQRDPNHLAYCSSICCFTALKQAIQVKQQDPKANVFVFYQEMRTPGQGEDFFRKAQQEGVIFVRTQAPEVLATGGKLAVEAFDELSGDKILLDDVDMVVLATGMVPATAFGEDFKLKKPEEEGKKEEMVASVDSIFVSDILNLDYRQGPELPELQNGFPDSHFICFPYESRRTGIYAAGPVRRPMGISNAIEDAAG